jgi:type IV pilus assembly PilX-like protein
MDSSQPSAFPGWCFVHVNNQGVALITALMLLAVLTLLGTTAMVSSLTEMHIGGNYKTSVQAFYDAEAGVHYALARLPSAIADGTLSFRGTAATETYTVTAPSGFSFNPITTFSRVGTTRNYRFQATGHTGTASGTLEVVFRRDSFFPYGVFGETRVDFFPSGGVYSYDSRTTPNPTPANSTHNADVASNGVFNANANPYIDGDVAMGNNGAGTQGTLTYSGTPTITGQTGRHVDRINADPLGANGGGLAATITTVHNTNNNAFVGITGNAINLNSGQSLTLTAGDYYLESVILNAGATLNIDTSSGDVNIYLTGGLEAQLGSSVNFVNPTGQPPSFSLYSNSNQPISFKHAGTMKGTIYAPFAKVEMKNIVLPSIAPVAYGLVWAKTVDMIVDFGGGQFYYDLALRDKFLSTDVAVVSWKDIRN